jgi:hypothetical protein
VRGNGAQPGGGLASLRRCRSICLLPVACCLLPVACCLLPVACCLLPVTRYSTHQPINAPSSLIPYPIRRSSTCNTFPNPFSRPLSGDSEQDQACKLGMHPAARTLKPSKHSATLSQCKPTTERDANKLCVECCGCVGVPRAHRAQHHR